MREVNLSQLQVYIYIIKDKREVKSILAPGQYIISDKREVKSTPASGLYIIIPQLKGGYNITIIISAQSIIPFVFIKRGLRHFDNQLVVALI